MGLSLYLARGINGAAAIDWSDKQQRNALLAQEIRDAQAVAAKVSELRETTGVPQELEQAVTLLLQVARQDVEELDDGTFQIAKGTAPGRVISISDPEARHGRKSAAKTIRGFKTHVISTGIGRHTRTRRLSRQSNQSPPRSRSTHRRHGA